MIHPSPAPVIVRPTLKPLDRLERAGITPNLPEEPPYTELWAITRARDETLLPNALDRYIDQIDLAVTGRGAFDKALAMARLSESRIAELEISYPKMDHNELCAVLAEETGEKFEIMTYETMIAKFDLRFLQ